MCLRHSFFCTRVGSQCKHKSSVTAERNASGDQQFDTRDIHPENLTQHNRIHLSEPCSTFINTTEETTTPLSLLVTAPAHLQIYFTSLVSQRALRPTSTPTMAMNCQTKCMFLKLSGRELKFVFVLHCVWSLRHHSHLPCTAHLPSLLPRLTSNSTSLYLNSNHYPHLYLLPTLPIVMCYSIYRWCSLYRFIVCVLLYIFVSCPVLSCLVLPILSRFLFLLLARCF